MNYQYVEKALGYKKGGVECCLLCWFCISAKSAVGAVASCSGFVWLTASILAWSRGGSPSNIAPSHGEGVWG